MYGLSETEKELVRTAAEIAANVLAPEAAEVDRAARFPDGGLAALGAAGFFGLCLPEAVGGKGQPPPSSRSWPAPAPRRRWSTSCTTPRRR